MFAKKIGAAVLAGICALTLAACGSSDTNSEGSSNSASDGNFVIYSPQGEGVRGEFMTTHAAADAGLEFEFVTGGGGELTSRLIQEKNNAQADLVLGIGEAQMAELDANGLFEPYQPTWADEIPAEFQRPDSGYTLFSQTPIVISYNSDVLDAEAAPKTWEDLAKPEYKDKFVVPGATSQTGQAMVVGVLWRYTDPTTGEVDDEGWDVLKGIMDNSLQLAQGEKFDWNRVVTGEVPIQVSWLGGIQTNADDFGINMEIVDAEGGSPFVTGGVGIVKGGDVEKAKEFIEWFGAPDVQAEFVKETNNDSPLNQEALDQLPDLKAQLEQVTPQDIDWAVVAEHLTEWMQRVQLEIL